VEVEVAQVLEQAVAALEGFQEVRSQCSSGTCKLSVHFAPSRNIDLAAQDVQNAVAAARGRLPIDIDPPLLTKVNPNSLPVLWLALHSRRPLAEIGRFAKKDLAVRMATIPQVGGVSIVGPRSPVVQVVLDPDRLAAFNLDAVDVVESLRQQLGGRPAGFFDLPAGRLKLWPAVEARMPDELARLVVAQREGAAVRLSEVAVVEEASSWEDAGRLNGKPAVGVAVFAAGWSDPAELAASLAKELPHLREVLPPDIELDVAVDYSRWLDPKQGTEARAQDLLALVYFPSGVSAGRADALLRQVEQQLTELKDPARAKEVVASLWSHLAFESGTQQPEGTIHIRLASPATSSENREEMCRAIRKQLHAVDGVVVSLLDLTQQPFPPWRSFPVEIALTGPDLEVLARWSQQVQQRLAAESTITDVYSTARPSIPETAFRFDREKAALHGLSIHRLAETLELAGGGLQLGPRGGTTDLRVRLRGVQRLSPEELQKLTVRGAGDKLVPIGSVVRIQQEAAIPVIERINGQRSVTLTANPAAGTAEARAREVCREMAEQVRQEMRLPAAYRVLDAKQTQP
jgi:multidrug efflux pump subunit AcrB